MSEEQTYYGARLAGALMAQIGEYLSGGIVGCRWEADFPFYYINDLFLGFTGYTYEEFAALTGGQMIKAVHPDDQARVSAIINSSLARNDSYQVEYRISKKAGGYAWLRSSGKRITDSEGKESIISVAIDITESVELRRQLEHKSRELGLLIDTIPCGIAKIRVDENLSIEFANEFFYNMLGYSPDEAKAARLCTVRFFAYPPDWPSVVEKMHEHKEKGSVRFELEHRCINKQGEIRWVLARCSWNEEEREAVTGALLDITARKQVEEQLRISEEEYRIAVRHTGNTIDVYDVASHTLTQPQEAADLFGLPVVLTNMPDSVLKFDVVEEGSREEYIRFYDAINRGNPTGYATLQLRDTKGISRWFDGQFTTIFGKDGTPQRAIISYEDITERRQREIAYQKWSQYFNAQQVGSLGYYEYNLTKDVYDRSEGTQFEELPNEVVSFTDMVNYIAGHMVCEEDIPRYRKVFDRKNLLFQYFSGNREVHLEHRRINAQGDPYWVEGSIQLLPDPYSDDIKAFVLIKNIDAEKKRALELQMLSERDTLTGLFNRRMVVGKISDELQESVPGANHALIMLDIDHFKQLNDTFGHRFGDQVIRELADKMQRQLRPGDFCGRLGGDEFVIFMRSVRSAEEMEQRLNDLSGALKIAYEGKHNVSMSMGLATFPRDGGDFDTLYQKADVALYEAKRAGRAGYVIYRQESE